MTTIPPPSNSMHNEPLQTGLSAWRIRKWSITWVFALYMIIVVVIALTLTALVINRLLSDSLALDQQNLLTERVAQQVEQVRDFRDTQLLGLRRIAADKQFPISATQAEIENYLSQALLGRTLRFSALALVSRDGKLVAATSGQVQALDFASMPWFNEAHTGLTGISHLHKLPEDSLLSRDSTQLVFFFYTPLGTPDGQPKYILAGLLPVADLWVYVDPVKFNQSGYAYLADDHAVLIAHGGRDSATGELTHALVLQAIGNLADAQIQTANTENLYGAQKIVVGLDIPTLAAFILDLPKDSTDAQIHRYHFERQNADKTSVLIPIGSSAELGVPVSIRATDWVLGITVNDTDFLRPLVRLRQALIIVSGISILISGLLGMLVAISISRPSRQLAKLAEQVQAGNYGARSDIRSGDEIGQLAEAMNAMLDQLTRAMQVQQGQLQTLQHTGEETSRGASSLSSAAEEMASAIEELNASAEQVGEAVQSMAHDAGIQMNNVQQTAQQIHSLDQEIGRIASLSDNLNQASGQMRELSGQAQQAIQQTHHLSRRVQTVLHLIEKFGRQTNMLALNATIEAARAGEMGASFVVVAEEVRRLAENSEQALQEIDALNKAIQQSIEAIQASVSQTNQAILVVAGMASELAGTASRQSQTSTGLVEITNRLAAIAETNAAGAEQIASSIEQQSTAFNEISSSSHELAVLAQKLQGLSNQLVGDQQPENERS